MLYFKKMLYVSIVLVAIALISVSAISASDINETNINTLGSHNDLSYITDFGNFNYDDFHSSENLDNVNNTLNEQNYKSDNFNKVSIEPNSNSDNIFNSVGKNSLGNNDFLNDLSVVQKGDSRNNKNMIDDIIQSNSLINSSDYTVKQISENIYAVSSQLTAMTFGVLTVSDLKTFKEAALSISYTKPHIDMLVLDFKDNLNLNFDPWEQVLIKMDFVKKLFIRGYGARISINSQKNDEYHFLSVNPDAAVWVNNITLSGFNTAIFNHGNCQLKNVIFKENQADYYISEDYGGAIRNWGILDCLECSFINNTAKYGGALYNDKGSQSSLRECLFYQNNKGYGDIDSSFKTLDCDNIYTSKGASCMVMNHNDVVKVVNINSNKDFSNFIGSIGNMGYVKVLILNFASSISYDLRNKLCLPSVENLYIRGNGATIFRSGNTPSDENSFLEVLQGQFILIDGLTIKGFNKAIFNQGALSIFNSHFDGNKVNYAVKHDYGGAIYNDEGLLTISNTTFSNNYAKYGGAIYNYIGVISCTNCIFKSNEAYKDGGAIFNHYGIMAIYNSNFTSSVAEDDGGAIYNDFGKVIVDNSSFVNSKAEKGKDVFSYGDDATINVLTHSSIVMDSDAPSTAVKWVARGIEILACFSVLVASTLLGYGSGTAGFICMIIGGLLAAGEEAFEECYLDHNFNIWNCVIMFGIAGIFDFAAGAISVLLANGLTKNAAKNAAKEVAKDAAKGTVRAAEGVNLEFSGNAAKITKKTTATVYEEESKELIETESGKLFKSLVKREADEMDNMAIYTVKQESDPLWKTLKIENYKSPVIKSKVVKLVDMGDNLGIEKFDHMGGKVVKQQLEKVPESCCVKFAKIFCLDSAIDAVSEVLTEVIPRFDVCYEHAHPVSTILDLEDIEIPHESDFNCAAV